MQRTDQQHQQPTPHGQVTDAERTRMHTQAGHIATTLTTDPAAPMTENTLIHLADQTTDSVRQRQYLLASLPPTYGMTQGEYADELRAVTR